MSLRYDADWAAPMRGSGFEAFRPARLQRGVRGGYPVLHLTGIGLGTMVRWPAGATLVRASGIAIGLAGLVFLARALGVPG